MKVKIVVAAFLIAIGVGHADPLNVDDLQLKVILERIFLDRHLIQDEIDGLLSDLNYASNRLVTVAKAVYLGRNTGRKQKRRAMNIVSKYGVSEDVDFLMSCATNHELWESAAVGTVVLLKGTTNAINRLDSLMQIRHVVNGRDELENDKGYAVECLLLRAGKADVAAADKDAAWRYALSFASNHVNYVESKDCAFIRFNPSFEHSRIRKGLMNYWQLRASNEFSRAYIERELGKLNQIPDSELND